MSPLRYKQVVGPCSILKERDDKNKEITCVVSPGYPSSYINTPSFKPGWGVWSSNQMCYITIMQQVGLNAVEFRTHDPSAQLTLRHHNHYGGSEEYYRETLTSRRFDDSPSTKQADGYKIINNMIVSTS
jgi:hypothetical protein